MPGMSDVSGKMLWFGFTFGSNFTFLSLKLIITQTKENKTPSTPSFGSSRNPPVAGDDKTSNRGKLRGVCRRRLT